MSQDDYDIHEVIEMALSDHTSFKQIESLYGLKEKDVKRLMRQNLKPGSYAAWRRRVRTFPTGVPIINRLNTASDNKNARAYCDRGRAIIRY